MLSLGTVILASPLLILSFLFLERKSNTLMLLLMNIKGHPLSLILLAMPLDASFTFIVYVYAMISAIIPQICFGQVLM